MDEKDMEKDILISIIIPVYNAEEFLTQCLDSICGQTYKNIEVILIDDGSTDGTKKICMNYLEKDNRIRYLYKKNEGPGIARNKGLEMANGQYIMFVDSDDYFYSPDNVDNIIRRIRKNQADLIMYNSGTYWNEDGEFVREGVIIEEKEIDRLKNEDKFSYVLSKGMIYSGVLSKVIKKEVLYENDIWYDNTECEDIVWSLKIYMNVKSIDWCNDLIYVYRKRKSGSRSAKAFTHENLKIVKELCLRICENKEKYDDGIVGYVAYLYTVWLAQAYLSKDLRVKQDKKEMKKCIMLLKYDIHPNVKVARKVYKIVGYNILTFLLGTYMKHLYKI
ncbi:glycosyltransferase family 2 protein [Dorea formicigenerans]|uniref:Glycosyltransferase family 2 protein n=1 Tax=Dorea formicigenerans TaxID=39486 RepID=A0A848CN21_9FIRM|nr:glycosyltransferase family 2 protein [Dorea formicigenerans]NME56341.1 glycosyltransferase family 2 protein [Dorea formicigenerans]